MKPKIARLVTSFLWAATTMPAAAAEVIPFEVTSPALAGNLLGDRATKQCLVYLPPAYADPQRHFPVLYVYHGFSGIPRDYTSVTDAVDALVRNGEMGDAIVVLVDGTNRLIGAFFHDSPVTGGFETYATRDVVDAVDAEFRTIPHAGSRALLGHSSGAYNAMHVALSHPDRFGVVSAHAGEYRYDMPEVLEYFKRGFPGPSSLEDFSNLDFFAQGIVSQFASTIPDTSNPPVYVTYPFDDVDGALQPNQNWDRFLQADIMHALERYITQSDRLRGIQIVHGRNDGSSVPIVEFGQAMMFSERLTELGIDHELFAHDRGHQVQPEIGARFVARHLAYVPPGIPDITKITAADFSVSVGRASTLSSQVHFGAPLPSGSRVLLNATSIGGPPSIQLTQVGDAVYSPDDVVLTPSRNGVFFLPIVLVTADGRAYGAHRHLRVESFPGEDLIIIDEDPHWTLEPSKRVTLQQANFEGQSGLLFEGTGSWSLSAIPEEPVSMFGFEALSLMFHPADYSVAEGRDPRLQVGSVDLLESIDLDRQEWQRAIVPIAELDIEQITSLQPLKFAGSLLGTFYLGDIRLIAEEAPHPATAVGEEMLASQPPDFTLAQNFPNPFNPETTIDFDLPLSGETDLSVYNLAGQRVATIARGPREAGSYSLRWDGTDDAGHHLASGMYIYRLTTGDQVQTRKLMLLR